MYRSICARSVGALAALGFVIALTVSAQAEEKSGNATVSSVPPAEFQEALSGTTIFNTAVEIRKQKAQRDRGGIRTAMAGPGCAPAPGPGVDECVEAAPEIFDGLTEYDTTGATTDGPPNAPDTCNDFGGVQTAADIWMNYTATCNGSIVLTTCENLGGSATYDTDLVVYTSHDCPVSNATVLGCNDDDLNNPCGTGTGDACANDGECSVGEECIDTDEPPDGTPDTCETLFHSTVIAPVTMGSNYKVRVGGWNTAVSDNGPGVLSLTCVGCGDEFCNTELGETCETCPEDCADAFCDEALGENCLTCEEDCGVCPCVSETEGSCDTGQIGIINFPAIEFNEADCWDLNGNGVCDPLGDPVGTDPEDLIGDGLCDRTDCQWSGLGFPIEVEAGVIDTVRVQFNTNFAGGDIYIVGESALIPCQPDVTDMRRELGCAVSGQITDEIIDITFDPLTITEAETLWVIFVGRTGLADLDNLGYYSGFGGTSHQVARNADGVSLTNRSWANLAGPGFPGLWSDLHLFDLGTAYCVELVNKGTTPGTYDCVANPDPVGACCGAVSGDPCGECPQDTDGSGDVRVPDLIVLLGCWGALGANPDCDCLDTDGSLDIRVPDLIVMLGAWGTCPAPVGPESTCEVLRGFECGTVGGLYMGDGSTCEDTCDPLAAVCTDDAGSCCDPAGNDTPGCDNAECCHFVCTQVDPNCCDPLGFGWDAICAFAAAADANGNPPACGQTGQDCAPPVPTPLPIATGSNTATDGYLLESRDELGCGAGSGFGGEDGHLFNPAGSAAALESDFSDAVYFYNSIAAERQALCGIPNVLGVNDDFSLNFIFALDDLNEDDRPDGLSVTSDESGNGVDDTIDSFYDLVGVATNLHVVMHQHVEQVVPLEGGAISVLTQDYQFQNLDTENAIDFVLLRQYDLDMLWGTADLADEASNDIVGTNTNDDDPGIPLYVYQGETAQPDTYTTISSPDADIYFGAKGGIDPDGDGPGGAYGFGTDVQEWDAFGVPQGWANNIAFLGYDLNGESGEGLEDPNCDPCDAHIGLRVPIHLDASVGTCNVDTCEGGSNNGQPCDPDGDPNYPDLDCAETQTVTYTTTYGSGTPWTGG